MKFIRIMLQDFLILAIFFFVSTSFAEANAETKTEAKTETKTASKADTSATLPNDKENYIGDAVRFLLDVNATIVTTAQAANAQEEPICIPGRTRMNVISQDNDGITVTLKENVKDCSNKILTSVGVGYKIKKEELKNKGFSRVGVTYGTLVLPFKYQLSGNKDITGSATVGAYVGWRLESFHNVGTTFTPIAFAGASVISGNGTNGNSSNTMGFSWGVGFIITLKGAFELGGAIGCDSVGSGANYDYNNKPWISVQIGYSFLQ